MVRHEERDEEVLHINPPVPPGHYISLGTLLMGEGEGDKNGTYSSYTDRPQRVSTRSERAPSAPHPQKGEDTYKKVLVMMVPLEHKVSRYVLRRSLGY